MSGLKFSRKIRSGSSWKDKDGSRNFRRRSSFFVSMPKKKKSKKFSFFPPSKETIKWLLLIGLAGIFVVSVWIFVISRNLPDPNRLIEREVSQSTKIYDRSGEHIIYEIFGDQKRTLLALDEIPRYVKDATVAIEDKEFYTHKGFSLWAIFRTFVTNILTGKKAGGSTLTQQLVKNAILTSEKTYTRKIKEVILAYQVEKKFNKDQILQMYLNEIPYGSTAYGVEAASQRYFGKSVKNVTLAEAATLAAIPQAPTRYSPYGANVDLLLARKDYVLDQMAEQGYITKEQAEDAKKRTIEFREPDQNITAPHFVMLVKEMLAEKYGEKMIEQGGLKIYTTLDLYKQKIAEEAIAGFAERNRTKYDAWNEALVSIDPKTGEVLAMVGSKDYFGESAPEGCVSGKNCKFEPKDNIAIRLRQPGSSLKPLVYATAFRKGYTPNTILYDVDTNFSNNPEDPYEPHNYTLKEYGPIQMKKALAGSLNTPAVKTLYLAGVKNVLDLAKDLGYGSFEDESRFGLSLVLGGGEVKMIEHANGYSAFAREGELNPISFILKVADSQGKVIEEKKDQIKKVLEPYIAREINNILSDNSNRAFVFGENNYLILPNRPVAAKTGTTNDYRDAWTIGYTPSLVTAVWVGNNDNSEMKRGADGSMVAAPIWNEYMKKVLGDTPVEEFKIPDERKTGKPILDGDSSGQIKMKIDTASGLLATQYTPENFIEEKIYKSPHSILHFIDRDDPLGDAPADPNKDPQYALWETAIAKWAEKGKISTSSPPTAYDNLHLPENRPTFTFDGLVENQTVTDPILKISVNGSAPRGVHKTEYYLDNALVEIKKIFYLGLEKDISFLPNGYHKLKVRVCDDIDNCSEKEFNFNLSLSTKPENQNIGIKWSSPSGALIVGNTDFPLPLIFNLTNPSAIKKIEVYREKDGQIEIISGAASISDSAAVAFWKYYPEGGVYKIYAKAYNWINDNSIETGRLEITVK